MAGIIQDHRIPAVVEATNEEASSNESGSQEVVANNENENEEILDNELHRRFLIIDKVTTNEVDDITDDDEIVTIQSQWCYCKNDDSYDDMIACDNNARAIQWFHYSC